MSTDTFPLKWPDGWPRTPDMKRMSSGRFGRGLTGYRAHSQLVAELQRLGAAYIVVSCNAMVTKRDGYIGTDGERRVGEPGVALYFQLDGRAMTMAQDLFDTIAGNMRSLGIAIESMRAIQRHGGGYLMARSFDGFAALPPPEGGNGQARPRRPWRKVLELEGMAGPNFAQLAGAEASYKTLARKLHPDVPGGSSEAMAEINAAIGEAREELGGHWPKGDDDESHGQTPDHRGGMASLRDDGDQ